MKQTRLLLAAGALSLALAATAGIGIAADDAGEARSQAMKTMGGSMKAIKDTIGAGGPAADIVAPAQKIAEIAATIPSLFPEGSDAPDDEAKAEIWQNWDDFSAKAKALGDEATLLASAAQGGDMATVGAQFDKVGGSCGACHKAYRAKP